jgi:catechol 2,3-dioxygenase-like lactoylglutathione lyase family enzyme
MKLEGIHHVALFASDMDATVRFWSQVLKAKLVRAGQDESEMGLRQYYFDVGGTLIGFFHMPMKDTEAMNFGWMHRLSLKADSVKDLDAWRTHIASFNVPVSEVQDRDFRKCILLHDPNGMVIEIAASTRAFDKKDLELDPKPVVALKEITRS